jgi:hypothetical protein
MSLSEDQADCCPHCRKRFEIVHVRFRLNGTAMVACCPNCAMVSVDVFPAAGLQIIDKVRKLGTATRAFWQKAAAPTAESTKNGFRYVRALLVGALATAASLRHFIYTHGGLPREEIRAGALMAIPIVALAIIFFRRKRQLRRKRQAKALPRRGASDSLTTKRPIRSDLVRRLTERLLRGQTAKNRREHMSSA